MVDAVLVIKWMFYAGLVLQAPVILLFLGCRGDGRVRAVRVGHMVQIGSAASADTTDKAEVTDE